jgi:hypothetical protein
VRARRLSKRIFSYEDALETFPTVRDLTAEAARRVQAVLRTAEGEGEDPGSHRRAAEEACSKIVEAWSRAVASVGCEAKGAWLVDWDCGDGCYCWQFPEETLAHFHTYEEGFAGRMPIN